MTNSDRPQHEGISIIVLDFDGVLTDNRVYVDQNGRETVACNRADGVGCELLRSAGIGLFILSTEQNSVVAARAKKLNVPLKQGERNKADALRSIMADAGADPARVMYVGNDVNDLDAMRLVGWPVTPADAHKTVRSIARLVTKAKGGDGVVREIADRLGVTEWRP